jgi:hypothetical protein
MINKQTNSVRSSITNAVRTAAPSNSTTNKQQLVQTAPKKELDPLKLEQQAKYKTSGLTVTSNDTNIIPRDGAGNIILAENQQNPLLVIEPVATKITTDSVIKVVDTRFNYYKFPVTIIETTANNVNLDTNINLDTADNVYARFRPSENQRIQNGTPGAYNDAAKFADILMDFVEDGLPQKVTNQYQITKEIKESGIDLRFRVKIEHRYDSWDSIFGNAYFSIIKNSPVTGQNGLFKGPFANQSSLPGNYWGAIGQYEVQTLYINEVIRNEEFEIGDYLSIGATADPNLEFRFHTINAIQSYWVIKDASKRVNEWNQPIPRNRKK